MPSSRIGQCAKLGVGGRECSAVNYSGSLVCELTGAGINFSEKRFPERIAVGASEERNEAVSKPVVK